MAYNKEQIAQYLIRIGLPTDMPQTAETLSRIIRAHFCTVPYEERFAGSTLLTGSLVHVDQLPALSVLTLELVP